MKTITTKKLKELLDKHCDLTLINTLGAHSFERTRIPGAINVPQDHSDFVQRVEQQVGGKDKPIVVYCANLTCDSSEKAAKILEEAGFTAVLRYPGGFAAWEKEAGEVHAGQSC